MSDIRYDFWNCACVQGPCPVHDPPTPAEDLYTMVDVLRRKLTNVCLMCGCGVEQELAFCSVVCQNRYTAPSADWKYTDPEGYYL